MAANLAGMFSQLNQAIGQNPLAGETGDNLINGISQNVGGLMGSLSQKITPQTPADPYSFMTQGAKQKAGQQDLSNTDLGTVGGLQQAATTYQKMGDMQNAMTMNQQAKQLEQENMRKSMAGLDLTTPQGMAQAAKVYQKMGNIPKALEMSTAANKRAEAMRKQSMAEMKISMAAEDESRTKAQEVRQRAQASTLAKRMGQTDMAEAINAGTLSPDAYMELYTERQKVYEMSRNGALVDGQGNPIYLGPGFKQKGASGTKGGPENISVYDKKTFDERSMSAATNTAFSRKVGSTIEKLENMKDYKAGLYATTEQFLATQLGYRGNEEALRTQITGILNSDAIKALPVGPASDRDVRIVRAGFPPPNAGREEILEYLKASQRITELSSLHDKMLAQYAITGKRAQFAEDWERESTRFYQKANVELTPLDHIEIMQQNLDNQRAVDTFRERYGWVPEEGETYQ